MQWIEDRIERIPISGCWLWMGQIHHSGYGVYKKKTVHRQVYQALTGEDITDKHVCHHCDVRSCVNPEHLFLGTHLDNMQDKAKKNRSHHPTGIANGRTTLTEQDVLAIRKDTRKIREVAAAYGIGKSQVSNIKSRISWSHI